MNVNIYTGVVIQELWAVSRAPEVENGGAGPQRRQRRGAQPFFD